MLVFLLRLGLLVSAMLVAAVHSSALDPDVTFFQFATTYPESETQLDVELSAIAQDPDGFLWLASPRGLVRFDGHDTITYRAADFPGVLSNRPTKLFMESSGNLLVASSKGLTRFDGKTFSPLAGGANWSNNIRAIEEDEKNRIWVGTDKGLFRLEGETFVPAFEESVFEVSSLLWQDGRLFIGGKGVIHIVSSQIEQHVTLPDAFSNSKVNDLELYNNEIWGATNAGLFSLNTERELIITPDTRTANLSLEKLLADEDGSLWFGGTKSLGRLLPNGKVELPAVFNEEFGLGPEVSGMIEDPLGNQWHTSYGYGLIGMFETPSLRISYTEGLSSANIEAVASNIENTVFVATDQGIDAIKNYEISSILKEDFNTSGKIRTLLADNTNQLWVGTDNGLRMIDLEENEWLDLPESRSIKKPVNSLAQDQQDSSVMWVGTDSGLQRLSPLNRIEIAPTDGLAIGTVIVNDDVVWLGTDKGLASLNNSQLEFHAEDLPGAKGMVVSIAVLPTGEIVAATANNGILVQHGSQWLQFTEASGLPPESVIRVDSRHDQLLLTTGAGTFSIPHAALTANKENIEVTPVMTNRAYRAAHVTFCCRGSNHSDALLVGDTMVTGSPDGVLMHDFNAVVKQRPAAKPYIKAVYSNKEEVFSDESGFIELTSNQRRLRIEYSALDLIHGPQLEFRYRLRGLDNEWVYMGKVRTAQLQHLPAGEFTFELQASPTQGSWTNEHVMLSISRQPAFIETQLFKFLVVCLVAAAIVFLIWLRSAAARRRHYKLELAIKQRTKILANLNRELKQRNTKLKKVSETDKLTGLVNRRYFESKVLNGEVDAKFAEAGLLIVLDIDHFKKVNDTYGHAAGDAVLVQFAQALSASTRDSDLVARWGGEEFMILCGCANAESATVLNRVVESIRTHKFVLPNKETLAITASVGAVRYPLWNRVPFSKHIALLFDLADFAMYAVKSQGRNGWAILESGKTPEFFVDENNIEAVLNELVGSGQLGWLASDKAIKAPHPQEPISHAAVNQ